MRAKLPPFHGNPSGLVEGVAHPCHSHLAIRVVRVWVPGQEGHRTQSRLRINQSLRDTSGRARCMQDRQPKGAAGQAGQGLGHGLKLGRDQHEATGSMKQGHEQKEHARH